MKPEFRYSMCECEHEAHFDRTKRSPNGNPAHKYGSVYFTRYVVKVKTCNSTFTVCKDCANDCMYNLETEDENSHA